MTLTSVIHIDIKESLLDAEYYFEHRKDLDESICVPKVLTVQFDLPEHENKIYQQAEPYVDMTRDTELTYNEDGVIEPWIEPLECATHVLYITPHETEQDVAVIRIFNLYTSFHGNAAMLMDEIGRSYVRNDFPSLSIFISTNDAACLRYHSEVKNDNPIFLKEICEVL